MFALVLVKLHANDGNYLRMFPDSVCNVQAMKKKTYRWYVYNVHCSLLTVSLNILSMRNQYLVFYY